MRLRGQRLTVIGVLGSPFITDFRGAKIAGNEPFDVEVALDDFGGGKFAGGDGVQALFDRGGGAHNIARVEDIFGAGDLDMGSFEGVSGFYDGHGLGCASDADGVGEILDEPGLDLISVVKNFLDSELLDGLGDDVFGERSQHVVGDAAVEILYRKFAGEKEDFVALEGAGGNDVEAFGTGDDGIEPVDVLDLFIGKIKHRYNHWH